MDLQELAASTPELGRVVGGYRAEAVVASTCFGYRNRYVAFFDVADGLIHRWSEYGDSMRRARMIENS